MDYDLLIIIITVICDQTSAALKPFLDNQPVKYLRVLQRNMKKLNNISYGQTWSGLTQRDELCQ